MTLSSNSGTGSSSSSSSSSENAPAAALQVAHVTKRFAGLVALSDVTLTLLPGEIVGLMGPNGSGKSTLVNVISGILRPEEGSVLVDGHDVTGGPAVKVARAGVSRNFQTVRLFAGLSVQDNIVSVIRSPRAKVDEVARDLMDRLGIGSLASKPAGSLAYGLQRRVEVARALATKPRYLLLDEPAAGLNDVESADLEEIIRALVTDAEYGCGVLIIDHDMRLMTSLCDRLHVLFNGVTLAEGPPEVVRRDPQVIEAYVGTRVRPGADTAESAEKKEKAAP